MSVSLLPALVGLIVFGGTNPRTGYKVEESASEIGFSQQACFNSWAKIGTCPLTINYLNNTKVRHEIGDKEDDINYLMIQVQEANDLATHILTKYGYWGELMKLTARKAKDQDNISKLNSKKRIEALIEAINRVNSFYANQGDYCTSMDFFCASYLKTNPASAEELNKEKKNRQLCQ